jgi:GDP-D-mannose dehydratase
MSIPSPKIYVAGHRGMVGSAITGQDGAYLAELLLDMGFVGSGQ